MKIAVACDGLHVSEHAERCDNFMCYTIDKGVLRDCQSLPNIGQSSVESAELLVGVDFDVLITDGIDMDMADALCDADVEVVAGVQGSPRDAVEAYVNDTLLGAVTLCQVNDSDNSGEDDIDSAFEHIAAQFDTPRK